MINAISGDATATVFNSTSRAVSSSSNAQVDGLQLSKCVSYAASKLDSSRSRSSV